MDRQLVEHAPDRWAGELEGLYIGHGIEPIPVTVKVTWTDGTEGEVNGWTSQWTRTYVCVYRETALPHHTFWVRASDVRRREQGLSTYRYVPARRMNSLLEWPA